MSMLLIQGSFQVIGAQPDGDSIHFTPDNPNDWNLLHGTNTVHHNGQGRTQLRLDAIDATETHYGPNRDHQQLVPGHAAADELLAFLGFSGIQRDAHETITAATPATAPGFILTRDADQFGRCIALVGAGQGPAASGTDVTVDVPLLQTTANHHLVKTGLAYPTFYRSLFPDLRNELTTVAVAARTAGLGLWPQDVTTTGVKITGLTSVTEDAVILPKLFRRLIDYFQLGSFDISGFPAYLAQRADKYTILSTSHFTTGLDLVVQVTNGDTLRMTNPPEDLVFDES
ncbi:thermonuclease family protein [Kitasatospora sp. NPDC051170]|uniref:thermonuclease family protein n=1 Tax=Kitasatospora sp. NPDC051170 TaxID=3364056 RepID=UPI0037A38C67